jgi:hypothetical protein
MIDKFFWEFFREIKQVQLNIGYLQDVQNSANKFIGAIENVKQTDPHLFFNFTDFYYNELLNIKCILIKEPVYKNIHHKLFTSCIDLDSCHALGVTRIFQRFLKGITCFKNEHEHGNLPAFYRLSENYYQCPPETFYIERLIYNELLKKLSVLVPRNIILQQAFETSLPIKVELKYLHSWPTCVTITRIENGIKIVEEYQKDISIYPFHSAFKEYCRLVSCKLSVNGVKKAKVQDYYKKRKWTHCAHASAPAPCRGTLRD